MRFFAASDIHGNGYAFSAFREIVLREKPDEVFFCGDIFGYYYDADSICSQIRQLGWKCLLGNHDDYILQVIDGKIDKQLLCLKYGNAYQSADAVSDDNIQFIRNLHPEYRAKIDNISIGFFHGRPEDALEGRLYPDGSVSDAGEFAGLDLAILGHTHHKMVKHIIGTTIVNPGSLGQERDGMGCSFLDIDTRNRKVSFRRVSFPVEELAQEVLRKDPQREKNREVLFRQRKDEFAGEVFGF